MAQNTQAAPRPPAPKSTADVGGFLCSVSCYQDQYGPAKLFAAVNKYIALLDKYMGGEWWETIIQGFFENGRSPDRWDWQDAICNDFEGFLDSIID